MYLIYTYMYFLLQLKNYYVDPHYQVTEYESS